LGWGRSSDEGAGALEGTSQTICRKLLRTHGKKKRKKEGSAVKKDRTVRTGNESTSLKKLLKNTGFHVQWPLRLQRKQAVGTGGNGSRGDGGKNRSTRWTRVGEHRYDEQTHRMTSKKKK